MRDLKWCFKMALLDEAEYWLDRIVTAIYHRMIWKPR